MAVVVFPTVVHVLKTYLQEKDTPPIKTEKGYINDASHLNLTPIDTIIDVPSEKNTIISQIKEIISYARLTNKKISIAGSKHSMGGHTIYENGIVLNMRPYNHMEIDSVSNILTIGSGALWSEALHFLNNYGKSISVMQAFSSFSIGGSISVNGHGWQHNSSPVSSRVRSFTLMNADGEIIECSRNKNKELFGLVIGGYGLFGVILDVKLNVVNDVNLTFKGFKFKSKEYIHYFEKYVDKDPDAQLVFGRLNISNKNFLDDAMLNIFRLSKKNNSLERDINRKSTELKRLIFRSTVNSEYGKRLRWNLETGVGKFISHGIYTRNQVLNEEVSLIENKDTTSTDILHEYFIPRRNFFPFISGLRKILPNDKIDLLNITIRNVYTDHDGYLAYAREEVFGFVMLFNQKRNEEHEFEMKKLTNELAQLALDLDGTYYLPYRLHVDKGLFEKIYPKSEDFFKCKLKYDAHELFQNEFYRHYKKEG